MVFDPDGIAGDLVAKDLEVNSDPTVVGFLGRAFAGPHDDGFDVLEISFNDFDPGEQFAFSIDVDPTSIRGVNAPGPNESGSVSGLELVGTTVTVTFADGMSALGYSYRLPDSLSGSEALVRAGLPASPLVEVYGVPTPPAAVANANQILHVTGSPGSTARVLVVEGGLFTAGLPGGGFDIAPFEANSAIQVQEYSGTVGATGDVDIPFMLTRSHADGGLNHIIVVLENSYAHKGMTSNPIILELQD
jgi:hypothetical protein